MKVDKKVVTTTLTTTSVSLDNIAEASAVCARFAEVKAIAKALKEEQDMLNALIRGWMGDADVATIDGVTRAKVSHRSRGGIEMADLKEVFPEAYELCFKTTEYDVLDAE
jgi:hypothetical protein